MAEPDRDAGPTGPGWECTYVTDCANDTSALIMKIHPLP